MKKVEARHNQAPNQAITRQRGGAAFESPQAGWVAQLEAMMESSPHVVEQAHLAATAISSPAMSLQRKRVEQIHDSAYAALQRESIERITNVPGVTVQREEAEEPLQSKSESLQRAETTAMPNNTGLPDNLKSGIESLSGISMDSVRVHYNSSQPAQLNALAYAQGSDIHVAPGQERHLPHEAWHVVQQAQGRVKPTLQAQGVAINDDQRLETEADSMGGALQKMHGQTTLPNHLAAGQALATIVQYVPVAQRVSMPAKVIGLTHLVQAEGGSVFEGEEVDEVTEGTPIEIETSDKLRSRRGPNQETNRAADYSGDAIYRWVRVVSVKGKPAGPGVYIRDDTFVTEQPNALGPRPSVISPDHRVRNADLPTQDVYLLGTTHSKDKSANKSDRISDEALSGADLIVEHPTPLGRGKTMLDATVQDITQEELIGRADTSNAQVIGADGRKLIDENHTRHAISIRSQSHTLAVGDHVDAALVFELAGKFIRTSLGLMDEDAAGIIRRINELGVYRGGNPDVVAVLSNGFRRVSTITKYFKPEVKNALSEKVLSVFRVDVEKAAKEYQEDLAGLEEAFGGRQLNEQEQQWYANGKRDISGQIRTAMISPFHDAISNLTLFSEALASNKANLVVAFGAEHVRPLDALMSEVSGVHKNYDIHNNT